MIALALTLACSGGSDQPTAPPPSRFDAVMADPADPQVDAAEFCEGTPGEGPSRAFTWPKLDGPSPRAAGGWTWVNLWATWCAPCIEEMPRLQEWEGRLKTEVGPGVLHFLSVDDTAGAVTRFREQHPDLRAGVRIQDFAQLPDWLPTIGLDAGAVLPIHVLLDAHQRILCVREGAVSEHDYEVAREILGG